jgi:hypothetical protein
MPKEAQKCHRNACQRVPYRPRNGPFLFEAQMKATQQLSSVLAELSTDSYFNLYAVTRWISL